MTINVPFDSILVSLREKNTPKDGSVGATLPLCMLNICCIVLCMKTEEYFTLKMIGGIDLLTTNIFFQVMSAKNKATLLVLAKCVTSAMVLRKSEVE